jgi:hypothetical protein
MLKELKTITLATLLVLGTAKLGSTEPLPSPNNQGDYMGRAYHTYWEVVDSDPKGLNCRMTNSSFEELMRADNRTPFEFFNWSIVGVLKQGQRFQSFPSNAGGTFHDTRGLPWLFVGKNYATGGVQRCFIRANSQFVKPVQSSSPFPVREILSQIQGKTRVPIFLPSELPFTRNNVYFTSRVETNGYNVKIGYTPNCNSTACFIGSISAERGGEPAQPPPKGLRGEFKTIKLADRTQGIFYNGCGASCTALVEWQYQGVLYQVTMKNGREETLVQIANSAIEAGPR